jgi:hypothetical protein
MFRLMQLNCNYSPPYKPFRCQLCLLMVIFGAALLVVIIVLAAWDTQSFILRSYSVEFSIEDCIASLKMFLSNQHHVVCKKYSQRILEIPFTFHVLWVHVPLSCVSPFLMACLEWTVMLFCFFGFRTFACVWFSNSVSICIE